LLLDVTLDPWPSDRFDAVFSANTTHIMSWEAVNDCFQCVANVLQKGGVFLLYGPFNYQGSFTSESNKSFDQHLKNLDSQMGIRDFEAINELAKSCGLVFQQDNKMPSNNRLLHFTKD
jgi:cyclopropane fatty-acyl-phospholipid synthase-like methyltransferase